MCTLKVICIDSAIKWRKNKFLHWIAVECTYYLHLIQLVVILFAKHVSIKEKKHSNLYYMFTKMFHIIHEWFELKKKNTFKKWYWYKNSKDKRNTCLFFHANNSGRYESRYKKKRNEIKLIFICKKKSLALYQFWKGAPILSHKSFQSRIMQNGNYVLCGYKESWLFSLCYWRNGYDTPECTIILWCCAKAFFLVCKMKYSFRSCIVTHIWSKIPLPAEIWFQSLVGGHLNRLIVWYYNLESIWYKYIQNKICLAFQWFLLGISFDDWYNVTKNEINFIFVYSSKMSFNLDLLDRMLYSVVLFAHHP